MDEPVGRAGVTARVRDVTVGQVLDGVAEYRPFIAVVVAIALLLVFLPAPNRSGGTNGVNANAGRFATRGTSAGGDDGSSAANAPPDAAIGNVTTAGLPETQTAGGLSPGSAPTVVPKGTYGYKALGSSTALSAPDCDKATGQLKMQTQAYALPCVPLWPKGADNGGATAQGVTATAIKVVVYVPQESASSTAEQQAVGIGDTNAQLTETLNGWLKLFHRHAELYGRQFQLLPVQSSHSSDLTADVNANLESERADAADAYNKYHPFAAVTLPGSCLAGGFGYQMALRKVFSVCSTTDLLGLLKQAEPYYWVTPNNGVMLQEQHLLFAAEMICKRLKGRNAKWAGNPVFRSQKRKFGYLYVDQPETSEAVKGFKAALSSCGVPVNAVGVSKDPSTAQEQIPTAISKFSGDGDNVVVLGAGFLNGGVATKQATNQNYRPEWFADGFAYTDATIFVRAAYDLTQAAALYAIREVGLQPPHEGTDGWNLYKWENGSYPSAKLLGLDSQLPVWLTLASAVHLAGPHLDINSVTDGLLAQPPHGGSYCGCVTTPGKAFGNRGIWPWESSTYFDNTAVKDTTFTWWSNSAQGQDETGKQGTGMMMFVDNGKRYRLGTLPTSEPDFFANNGTPAIAELPPNERPPAYSNKQGCASRQACYG